MRISGTDAALNTFKIGSESQGAANDAIPVSPKIRTLEKTPQQKNTDTVDIPVTEKVISEAVEKMNKVFEGSSRRFEYSVHEKTHGIMVKVIDEVTGEVIREIPPKKILDMVANMMEMAGLIVDERR